MEKKSYRVKREGDTWVPQWGGAGDWRYYATKTRERVKFSDKQEADAWLEDQKRKEGQLTMKAYKVTVGEYDDKAYYVVLGAKTEDQVMEMLKAWFNENYAWGWYEPEPIEITEINILRKGVIQL